MDSNEVAQDEKVCEETIKQDLVPSSSPLEPNPPNNDFGKDEKEKDEEEESVSKKISTPPESVSIALPESTYSKIGNEDDRKYIEQLIKTYILTLPPGSIADINEIYKAVFAAINQSTSVDNTKKLGSSIFVPDSYLVEINALIDKYVEESKDREVSRKFEEKFKHVFNGTSFNDFVSNPMYMRPQVCNIEKLNYILKKDYTEKAFSAEFQRRLEIRKKMPTMIQKDILLSCINLNQILLIVGSSGCGKTTQVPQLILDSLIKENRGSQCRIICTQPRRIAAIAVAERVAYERCEAVGKSVGYQISLESALPRAYGSIIYCTAGILTQTMQSDPLLQRCNYLILDEVHERDVENDILMGLLKYVLPYRPDLKIILMSATVSEKDFSVFFNDCCIVYIRGTLFPVEMVYLEDILTETNFTNFKTTPKLNAKSKKFIRFEDNDEEYAKKINYYLQSIQRKYPPRVIKALQLVDSEGGRNCYFLEFLIFYICEKKPDGAILVFLPGYERISNLTRMLQNPTCSNGKKWYSKIKILPLHSSMPTAHQKDIFEPPPKGFRKIILSTILAETSITIDDVVYVINTGRAKINNYNHALNMQTLDECWISKSNIEQRRGRAGRVQPGICYNLYTRDRERRFAEKPVPEILRSKLDRCILQLKMLHFNNTFKFFNTLLTKPVKRTVENGIQLLKRIEALDNDENLTALGLRLAQFPIAPQMGKMLIMSALFRCVDPITSVAAALSFKSPFYSPLGKEDEVDDRKYQLSRNCYSDHLLIHNVVQDFREARKFHNEKEFCSRNFLSKHILNKFNLMKQQFSQMLKSYNFVDHSECRAETSNANSNNQTLLRTILTAGLYPNMAYVKRTKSFNGNPKPVHKISTPVWRNIQFHPFSINNKSFTFPSHYFIFFGTQRTSGTFIMDTTMVYPMSLLLFGDRIRFGVHNGQSFISVGECYNFRCRQEVAETIVRLRENLKYLIETKVLDAAPIEVNSTDENLIKAVMMLLSLDNESAVKSDNPRKD